MSLNHILDMVYPRACIGCHARAPENSPYLCWDCQSSIMFVQPPFCSQCGDPVSGYIDHDYICSFCAETRPAFDRARSVARYEGVVRQMLRDLKYNDAIWLVGDLARMLEICARAHYDLAAVDVVCAVPLYGARQRQRGYNQSRVLAEALAERIHKPFISKGFRRIRPTPTQTDLTAGERLANVKDAFSAVSRGWIEGKRILLIDDVMTTGATVHEASRALRKCGASRIYVLTAARG
ncbi:MAG TPA: ComF family protein [Kiritimatiellia bacterium]|nr:ComF family protein [Kiritimatiellia bacterium]HNS80767.1 ComF family protein [Kiritimatiellia bacterium]HQQ05060.1 ComF family protein [Kiritimatiellia bacterium]